VSTATIELKPNGPDSYGEQNFSAAELKAIRELYAPKATDAQFTIFLMEAKRRRLMPGKQLYFRLQRQGEYDPDLKKKIYVYKPIHITGIDAFRLIAQRTGKYAGQKPVVWIYKDQAGANGTAPTFTESEIPLPGVIPYAARVTILREGFAAPMIVIARWDAYVQTYKNDQGDWVPNPMWMKLGPEMLAKCGEALGLRKAFPEDLWGLYIAEEFPDNPEDAEPQAQPAAAALLPPASVAPPVSTAPAQTVSEKSATPETPTPANPSPAPAETPVKREPVPPATPAPAPSSAAPTAEDFSKRFGGKPTAAATSENEAAKSGSKVDRPAGRDGAKWYLREVLDKAGVKDGGELIKRYLLKAAGVSDSKKIKPAQWDAALSVLDGKLNQGGPAAVVEFLKESAKG